MITTLSIICAILFAYIVYQGGKVIKECREEERFIKERITGYPKAIKPTKAEILERNEVDRLLELDEYPTIVRQINLDQHEKAIS